mmetsp:Transcript_36544/g.105263  ORF Transcript_36544/g.105263 Transcript_36544/m.105263 type:complete len:476 (+) Transcript_36544:841-2268(+)
MGELGFDRRHLVDHGLNVGEASAGLMPRDVEGVLVVPGFVAVDVEPGAWRPAAEGLVEEGLVAGGDDLPGEEHIDLLVPLAHAEDVVALLEEDAPHPLAEVLDADRVVLQPAEKGRRGQDPAVDVMTQLRLEHRRQLQLHLVLVCVVVVVLIPEEDEMLTDAHHQRPRHGTPDHVPTQLHFLLRQRMSLAVQGADHVRQRAHETGEDHRGYEEQNHGIAHLCVVRRGDVSISDRGHCGQGEIHRVDVVLEPTGSYVRVGNLVVAQPGGRHVEGVDLARVVGADGVPDAGAPMQERKDDQGDPPDAKAEDEERVGLDPRLELLQQRSEFHDADKTDEPEHAEGADEAYGARRLLEAALVPRADPLPRHGRDQVCHEPAPQVAPRDGPGLGDQNAPLVRVAAEELEAHVEEEVGVHAGHENQEPPLGHYVEGQVHRDCVGLVDDEGHAQEHPHEADFPFGQEHWDPEALARQPPDYL